MEFIQPLSVKLDSMWIGTIKAMPLLFVALVLLLITWLVARIAVYCLRSSMRHAHIRPSLKELFGTLLRVAVWVVGVLISVTVLFPSLTPAKLLTALGLGSVAVGLAFKDIFENFFAGILIMLRKPMRLGDFIECEGVMGKVERIALRETYIRQIDDQLILVPNSFLFTNPLYILTDKPLRRFEIIVGIAYGEHMEAARSVIRDAIKELELVNHDRPIEVYAREFNSSSMDFTVRWWARSTPLDMHQSRDKVVTAIKLALDQAGIEIPFPYRTLTFKDPLMVHGIPAKEEASYDSNTKHDSAG